MKLRKINHKDGDKYVEIHYDGGSEGFLAKFYKADGTFLKEHDFPVVSLSEVEAELAAQQSTTPKESA